MVELPLGQTQSPGDLRGLKIRTLRLPDVFGRMHAATKPPTLGIVLVVLGGVFLLTAVVAFCPIYSVFKLSTNN